MYKTVVEKVKLTKEEIVDDSQFWHKKEEYLNSLNGHYIRIRLIERTNSDELRLTKLLENGLNSAPQGSIKLT